MPIRRLLSFTPFAALPLIIGLQLPGTAMAADVNASAPAAGANAGVVIDNDHRDPPPAANPPIGCSRKDWLAARCSTYPSPGTQNPPDSSDHPRPDRPYPGAPYPGDRYDRRPVVVIPTAAPVDDTPLTDDWEGCRRGKLRQLDATRNGDLTSGKQLEEWLWKNCRNYSEDLRQLEQDAM